MGTLSNNDDNALAYVADACDALARRFENDGPLAAEYRSRAAVAREVLTDAIGRLESAGRAHAAEDLGWFRDEFCPAPPAPETVTVDGNEWRLNHLGEWTHVITNRHPSAMDAQYFANRIASDARVLGEKEARIAELEQRYSRVVREHEALHDSLEQTESVLEQRIAERDAALRALEEKGDGLGAAALNSEREAGAVPSTPVAVPKPEATRPAPIPLGAVVEVEGVKYRLSETSWRHVLDDSWFADNSSPVGKLMRALYHARHPVATRETVERVDKAILVGGTRDNLRNNILRALGFTLEGA